MGSDLIGLSEGRVPEMIKILFLPDTLKLLGVHAIGEDATEIIHIGQGVDFGPLSFLSGKASLR